MSRRVSHIDMPYVTDSRIFLSYQDSSLLSAVSTNLFLVMNNDPSHREEVYDIHFFLHRDRLYIDSPMHEEIHEFLQRQIRILREISFFHDNYIFSQLLW